MHTPERGRETDIVHKVPSKEWMLKVSLGENTGTEERRETLRMT